MNTIESIQLRLRQRGGKTGDFVYAADEPTHPCAGCGRAIVEVTLVKTGDRQNHPQWERSVVCRRGMGGKCSQQEA